jgi:hypothetical protein
MIGVIGELRRRERILFWVGALHLFALACCILLAIFDTRQILGINRWIKPMKFLISSTIFLWSVGWFMEDTKEAIWKRRIVRYSIALAMLVENFFVLLQAARGTTSHFNNSSPFDAIVFGLMGLVIVYNTFVMMLFFSILRTDTPPKYAGYLWGIRMGVLIFIVASWQGFVIVANNAHTVGAPDGGAGLPFVNWSTTAGDLRIAHFIGLHALQILPLLGLLIDRSRNRSSSDEPLGSSTPRNIVVVTAVFWLAIMGAMLLMALRGMPLLRL